MACKDDLTEETDTKDGVIHFSVNLPPADQTKGTPVNNVTDTAFNTIGILGYHTSVDFEKSSNPTSSFLANEIVRKTKTNIWNFDKIHYWPQKGVVSYFAYAPFASPENGISITELQNENPVLTYQVPHEVAKQPDLMVATPQFNKYKEVIPLNFTHALACIGFDVSGENILIDSIGIRGVYTSGTLNLTLTDNTPLWSNLTGVTDKFYKVGLKENPMATNPSSNVMATNGYLMMIPQTLGDDAAIIIKFKGTDPKIIPLKTAGTTQWRAGDKYIYTLKEGTYNFEVIPETTTFDYFGGKNALNIKSTYTSQAGLTQNLGWKAEIISSSPQNIYW